MVEQAKNTICLWYDGDAEDAARFYAKTFPDSSVASVHLAPGDFPSGKKGDVASTELLNAGSACIRCGTDARKRRSESVCRPDGGCFAFTRRSRERSRWSPSRKAVTCFTG